MWSPRSWCELVTPCDPLLPTKPTTPSASIHFQRQLNSTVNVLAFHDGLQFDQILRMYCAFDIFSSYQNCTLSCSGYDPENQGPYIIRPEPLPPSPVPTQSPTQHTLRPTPWPTPPPTPAPTPNATLPTPQPTPGPTPAPTNASVPV